MRRGSATARRQPAATDESGSATGASKVFCAGSDGEFDGSIHPDYTEKLYSYVDDVDVGDCDLGGSDFAALAPPSRWDTSRVTNMAHLFNRLCSGFNENID